MEQQEKIEKLKKSEREILNDIYTIMFYIAIVLIALYIIMTPILSGIENPIPAIIFPIIMAMIYIFVLVYLIGLAVAFGMVRAKWVLLKAENDVKEEEKQEEK